MILNEGIKVFRGSAVFKKALKTMQKQINKGKTSEEESDKILNLLQDGYDKFKDLEDKYEKTDDPEKKKKLKEEYSKLKKEYLSKTERAKKVIKYKGPNREVTNARLIGTGIASNILTPAFKKLLKFAAITGLVVIPVGIGLAVSSSVDTDDELKEEFKYFNY